MKSLILFLGLTWPALVSAQQFVVRADKMNKVYIGIENLLTIVSGSCGCDALVVTADKGHIEKVEGCKYRYLPSATGNAELTVSEKKGGKMKVIGKNMLRVRPAPAPKVTIGGISEGSFPLSQFKVQSGLTLFNEGLQFDDYGYKIDGFTLVMVRKETTDKVVVKGNMFDAGCQKIIASLQPGDKIIIENIHVLNPNGIMQPFNSMSFTMK